MNDVFYVYKIEFSSGHYYIGRRKMPKEYNDPMDDPYMGSPVTNAHYWEKYEHKKIILDTYSSSDDYTNGEHMHLGDKWKTDKMCLNASPANNKSNANMKWCNNGLEDGMFSHTPEGWSDGRLSTSAKGKFYYNDGENSKMFSEGEQPSGWVRGNLAVSGKNNPSCKYGAPTKGKIAYNNGSKIIYLDENEEIPNGFVLGATDSFKNKRRKATIGKNNPRYGSRGEKWYNNGLVNKLCIPGSEPIGFKMGMVKKKNAR